MIEIRLNSPCPCGSGLKYKDCCFREDQDQYNQSRERLIDKLIGFVKDDRYSNILDFVLSRYLERLDPGDEVELTSGEFTDILYVTLFDIYAFEEKRLIDIFKEEEMKNLPSREREILTEWSPVLYSVYQLKEINEEKGCYYHDILRGCGFYVRDHSLLSEKIEKGNLIACRIIRVGLEYQPLGDVLEIPSSCVATVIDYLQELIVNYREFLNEREGRMEKVERLIRSQVLDIMMIPELLENDPGEMELDLHESYYTIKEPSFIIDKLKSEPNIVYDEDNYLLWLDEESDQVKARIGVIDNELILQTRNREKQQEARELIRSILGIAARHREDLSGQIDTSQLAVSWKERLGFADLNQAKMKNPEMKIGEYLEKWLDKPLEIIEGNRPRQIIEREWGKKLLMSIFARLHGSGILGLGEEFLINIDLELILKELGLTSILSAEAEGKVEKLLMEKMGDYYTEIEKRDALLLWRDFIAIRDNISGKLAGWAAAMEYIISKLCYLNFTQQRIAAKYGVSETTISKRYREILPHLKFIDL